jgi:glycosyltransferase involved in cell wall biosynthesis
MKIIALLHAYPPLHNAGAEWYAHEMFKFLKQSGHDISVRLPISNLDEYVFEGIPVYRDEFFTTVEELKKCDIIISHLDRAGKSLNYAEHFKKPYVQIIHNSNYYGILTSKHKEKNQGRFVYVIYNSQFTRDACKYPNPSVVLHPPVDPVRYKVNKKGNKITLINLFERKGGIFFQDLAKAMPDRQFLGVEGGYGRQQINESIPNIEYMSNTPDARKIYSRTRLLVMPSFYESYGRTGIEAMVSGIPVIATPTPGLKESLSYAGTYCPLDSIEGWVDAIKKFDDEAYYKEVSKDCVKRVKEIIELQNSEMDEMERFLMDIYLKRI